MRKTGSGVLWGLGAATVILAVGCGGESPPGPTAARDSLPAPLSLPRPTDGVIAGTIGLQLKEPGQPAEPLPNVFVYIKSGLEGRTYPLPADPVVLDQINFQFVPHVFGIRAGQTLRITSQDTSQHNVFCQPFKNPGFNDSLFGGEVVEKKFTAPEVMILMQCNIHHIMKAYAGVLDHPFFTVTKPDGSFEIKGLPPGRYTLTAWQEMMGNQDVEVDLRDGGRKALTLTYH